MKEIALELIKRTDLLKVLSSLTLLFSLLVMVYALLFREIPEANREAVINLLGIIEGCVLSIFTFYFGSSVGSKAKTDIIDKITNK